jgi:hypothetical protein
LVARAQVVLELLGEAEVVLAVAALGRLPLAAFVEPRRCVLAHRLEQRQPGRAARAPPHDHALGHELLERVQLGRRDLLGGGDRGAAREHRQPGEGRRLGLAEQAMAPFERRLQRLLALRGVDRPAPEPRAEPSGDLAG